jgi:AcrR family transcriptional regulator
VLDTHRAAPRIEGRHPATPEWGQPPTVNVGRPTDTHGEREDAGASCRHRHAHGHPGGRPQRLLADGYAGLSTRKVADEAGVPLSQLHYHFGSKSGLILELLRSENRQRLERQNRMYAEDKPLWQRYEQACDFLEDDLDSGYVRVLQEMIAAGWSNREIGDATRELLSGWFVLLADVAREAEDQLGPLGPVTAEELATLVGSAFIGSEAMLLLGCESTAMPLRSALRRIGVLIRKREEGLARAPEAKDARKPTAD